MITRGFIRVGARTEVKYSVFGTSSSIEKGRLNTVSKRGVSISGNLSLPKDSIIKLRIDKPGKIVNVIGEVVWSKKREDNSYSTGMKVMAADKEAWAMFLQYAYNESLKAGRC